MRRAINVTVGILRVGGLIQIVLGLAFWVGFLLNLVPIHMLVGLIVVVALWVLAGLAARSGVGIGFVALAAVWGLIVPIFGIMQAQLLPGAAHWVIEVLHLVVGLVALGMGDRLATLSKQKLDRPVEAVQ